MQFTAALLAGALATAATACTPDLRDFTIQDLSETYVKGEGTTWSFTAARPESGEQNFDCHGFLAENANPYLLKGTCGPDAPQFTWTAGGYHPKHPVTWHIILEQTVEHCPPAKGPKHFLWRTRILDSDLECAAGSQIRNGHKVPSKHCKGRHDIAAPRETLLQ